MKSGEGITRYSVQFKSNQLILKYYPNEYKMLYKMNKFSKI